MPNPFAAALGFGLGGGQAAAGIEAADAAKKAAKDQVRASTAAIERLEQASQEALQFFEPFQPVVDRGIESADFLANPEAQLDFLEGNPLFQASLRNVNRGTTNRAAATGRLGAGDTQSELFENFILAASPLIDRQREDVGNLLNFSTGITGNRANARLGVASQQAPLIAGIGDARAAGRIGASNAQQQTIENLFGLAAQFAGGGALGPSAANLFTPPPVTPQIR